MSSHLFSLFPAAPVLLGGAVRPPINLLTALIGVSGLGLGAWLCWMGIAFDRPATAPARPGRPDRDAPASEPRPAGDGRKTVV